MNDIKNELKAVSEAIVKSGYDPIKQLSCYVLSEDPIYITELDGARARIRKIDRDDILSALITEYLNG